MTLDTPLRRPVGLISKNNGCKIAHAKTLACPVINRKRRVGHLRTRTEDNLMNFTIEGKKPLESFKQLSIISGAVSGR